MPEPDLTRLQRWMSEVIRHPADSEAGSHTDVARAEIPRGAIVAGEVIKPSTTMDPLRRMDVYNGGYLSRLVEVLETDFDALKYALGDDTWLELARAYVYAHPSQHPNLNHFGAHVADFIAARQDLEQRAFLRDLARLQWAVVQSFDAPEFEPLDLQKLGELTQEQWAGAVLRTNPSVRVTHFDFPVHRYLQDFYDGKRPSIPEPVETRVLTYRKDGRTWRVRLPDPIAAILEALIAGEPFGVAVQAGGDVEQSVQQHFQEWAADGIFASVEVA